MNERMNGYDGEYLTLVRGRSCSSLGGYSWQFCLGSLQTFHPLYQKQPFGYRPYYQSWQTYFPCCSNWKDKEERKLESAEGRCSKIVGIDMFWMDR